MAPLLTINEVADLLRVHHATLRRLLHQREIQGIRVGGQWRFEEAELERFKKRHMGRG